MSNKEQEYAKSTFNEVAHKYDEIPFFKISAEYVVELIREQKEEFYEAMFKEADMDGEIELIADSHFLVVE